MNWCLYSGLALATWPITARIRCEYGLPTRMRSCALRILLAATISIALVIFCVLLMLDICVRISLAPAMRLPQPFIALTQEKQTNQRLYRAGIARLQAIPARNQLPGLRRLELRNRRLEAGFDVFVPIAARHDLFHQIADFAVCVGNQPRFQRSEERGGGHD